MPTRKFISSLENLETISNYIVQAARKAGLDDSAIYAVQLAVDEAATNIIEHAYRGVERGVIELSYEILTDGLKVVLRDHGVPFDPGQVPDPVIHVDLEELKPRGLGLFFIRRMMDEVRFDFSTRRGNTLTMIKRKNSRVSHNAVQRSTQ